MVSLAKVSHHPVMAVNSLSHHPVTGHRAMVSPADMAVSQPHPAEAAVTLVVLHQEVAVAMAAVAMIRAALVVVVVVAMEAVLPRAVCHHLVVWVVQADHEEVVEVVVATAAEAVEDLAEAVEVSTKVLVEVTDMEVAVVETVMDQTDLQWKFSMIPSLYKVWERTSRSQLLHHILAQSVSSRLTRRLTNLRSSSTWTRCLANQRVKPR